jgi:hypothetical protein
MLECISAFLREPARDEVWYFLRWENAQPWEECVGYIAPMMSWKISEESNAPFKCLKDELI